MAITTTTASARFLLSILASVLLFSAVIATSADSPFMLAHKKVALTRLKSGAEQISVSIEVYNQGSATAYDVSLNDDTWPKDTFDLVSGSTSKTWEKLDFGSIASHSFVLESKVKGVFQPSHAIIKFRVPTRAALQEAHSTPVLPLDILADKPQEKKLDLAKGLLSRYGSLVSVVSIVVLFVYLVATPSKSSKKRR